MNQIDSYIKKMIMNPNNKAYYILEHNGYDIFELKE